MICNIYQRTYFYNCLIAYVSYFPKFKSVLVIDA